MDWNFIWLKLSFLSFKIALNFNNILMYKVLDFCSAQNKFTA